MKIEIVEIVNFSFEPTKFFQKVQKKITVIFCTTKLLQNNSDPLH